MIFVMKIVLQGYLELQSMDSKQVSAFMGEYPFVKIHC